MRVSPALATLAATTATLLLAMAPSEAAADTVNFDADMWSSANDTYTGWLTYVKLAFYDASGVEIDAFTAPNAYADKGDVFITVSPSNADWLNVTSQAYSVKIIAQELTETFVLDPYVTDESYYVLDNIPGDTGVLWNDTIGGVPK